MTELLIALGVFACLFAVTFAAMHFYPRLPSHHRDDETFAAVRTVTNIFMVMTSLVFGLMINSAKNTFETIDHNVHAYATDLILLDRTLRSTGDGAAEARRLLEKYVAGAIAHPARADDPLSGRPNLAEQEMNELGDALAAIRPTQNNETSLLDDARQQYRRIVELRWTIVEQSEGAIPMPLIGMLVAWLALIFASFGFRAPRNAIIVSVLIVAQFLIAASIYLVLDMDIPFAGPIQISDTPLHRALAEIQL